MSAIEIVKKIGKQIGIGIGIALPEIAVTVKIEHETTVQEEEMIPKKEITQAV